MTSTRHLPKNNVNEATCVLETDMKVGSRALYPLNANILCEYSLPAYLNELTQPRTNSGGSVASLAEWVLSPSQISIKESTTAIQD